MISRRRILATVAVGAASALLAGCATVPREAEQAPPQPAQPNPELAGFQQMYGPEVDDGYDIPAVPIEKVDPRFYRQLVPDPTGERPGTIVIDTTGHFLYLVRDDGQALRYGVGLGRAGFAWAGRAQIQWKQKWPRWVPPDEMIARQPELAKYSAKNGGMAPGLDNPLGARAHVPVPERQGHALPHPRLAGMVVDRQVRLVGLRAG